MTHRPPVEDPVRPDTGTASALSLRDVEVLRCLAEGRSTGEIAAALAISVNTARTRIRRVQRKLAVTERESAVRAARELGILPVPQPRRPIV
jgi:DNA-binding CsgD family transcriptional regulator